LKTTMMTPAPVALWMMAPPSTRRRGTSIELARLWASALNRSARHAKRL
jgi:hypothetical protein